MRNSYSLSVYLYSFWLLSQVIWSSHLLQLSHAPNPFQNPFQGPVTRYFSIKKKGKKKKHRYSSTMRSTMIGIGKQRTHGMKFHACYGAVHQPCWWVTNLLWPPLGVHNFGLILHQLGCAGGLSDPLPCGVSLKEQWGVTQTQKNIPNSPLRRQNICNCFKVVILLLICDTPLMFAVPLAKQTRPVCSSSCSQLSWAYWHFWGMLKDIRSNIPMLSSASPNYSITQA